MRVMIVGSGAMGLLFGGWLQSAGVEVVFLARGERLAALRAGGIVAEGPLGFSLARVEAAADPLALGPVDALFVSVKLYDLEAAVRAALPALRPDGVCIAVQNGISSAAILEGLIEPARLVVGPVYPAAHCPQPNRVSYGAAERIVLGSPAGAPAGPCETLLDAWRRVGVDAAWSGEIRDELWRKFLPLATNAALTCLARQPAGVIYTDPALLRLARRSIAETLSVGRAEGVAWADDAADRALAFLRTLPASSVSSMRQDLDAGRPLELDGLTGELVRLAGRHGLETPFHETAYACLKPYRSGAPA
jgi:2-dehydropantoate 2-reductase